MLLTDRNPRGRLREHGGVCQSLLHCASGSCRKETTRLSACRETSDGEGGGGREEED